MMAEAKKLSTSSRLLVWHVCITKKCLEIGSKASKPSRDTLRSGVVQRGSSPSLGSNASGLCRSTSCAPKNLRDMEYLMLSNSIL